MMAQKGLELELEFFIVHKEANFDLWDQSIHVFFIRVSFLKRGISSGAYLHLIVEFFNKFLSDPLLP